MSELSLERLRQDGQAFTEAISREYYLALSGQKPTAELQPLYEQYAPIMNDESLALTREEFQKASAASEEQRSTRILLEWQAEAQSSRALASLDEREIAWEAAAMVALPDGERVPYQRVAIDIANSGDRAERLTLDAARVKLVEAELSPLRLERLQREREITEQLQIAPSYNATFELLSGVPLMALRAECEQFLRDTQSIWDDVFPEFLKRGLNISPADATRSDALALMRAKEFDAYFPWKDLEPQVVRQMGEMGISATAHDRVRFDTGERPGKQSRAFCAPVLVPDEVYLVLRPHGGQSDWSTFLHELGHALHFANMRPELPFEYRWLGDNSITEGYAMLFDHLMEDRGWLLRYTSLGATTVPGFLRSSGFEELHMLRRYCAKLIYETQLHGGELTTRQIPDLYAELLTGATGFRYSTADAFVDVDARYYAVRYLRAWQLQALLTQSLVERFDADWWRNPRAGPWIVEQLYGEGQRELAHEQAARVTGKPLSFAPLVKSVERLLA